MNQSESQHTQAKNGGKFKFGGLRFKVCNLNLGKIVNGLLRAPKMTKQAKQTN